MSKFRRRRRPSAAFIISCLALFMALGGVSYGFAAGSIDSREIKNNDVRGKDVRKGTLSGSDVKDDALKGADVDENSFGKVPSAANADNAAHATSADNAAQAGNANTVGGVPAEALTIGRSGFLGTCEPGALAIKCAQVTLDLPRPGRVLVTTGGQWHSDDPAGTSLRGICRVLHNDANLTAPNEEGSLSQQTDGNQEQALSTTTAVTGVLPAGPHEFALSCSDDVGDMDFTDTRISAILLGSS
jgi:hypothetical protein